MSQQTEMKDEKLNKLNLNKETISDLDAQNDSEVKGGGLSILPGRTECHVCEGLSKANLCPPKTWVVNG